MAKTPHESRADAADISAWFLGPKAEHADNFERTVHYVLSDYVHWRRNFFPNDPTVISRERRRQHELFQDRLNEQLDEILGELKADFPFFHPRYIAHMVSEQLTPAVLGLIAGVLYNPNNVSEEAAPVSVRLELEVGRMVGEMLGFDPQRVWAHLTSGGTIANLEALWGARRTQFAPLALKDLCSEHKLDFEIELPGGNGNGVAGRRRPGTARGVAPSCGVAGATGADGLSRQRARRRIPRSAVEMVSTAIDESQWNVVKRGFHNVAAKLGKQPVVFAPATAHYSIKKACALLGYGQDALHLVPINTHFRQEPAVLESMLRSVGDDEYIAFVMGVAGTSEEGAVDPIHEFVALRDRYAAETGKDFWLHVDCAWGGYAASIVRGHDIAPQADPVKEAAAYAESIDARHSFNVDFGDGPSPSREVFWSDPDVIRAYLAIGQADSATIDAHKQGYIPYPAGIIVFAEGLITELLTEKANVTFEPEEKTFRGIEDPPTMDAVGPYIIEGSKPGSMAISCWLAHKTVPLTIDGHGQIVRETVGACAPARALLRPACAPVRDASRPTTASPKATARGSRSSRIHDPDLNILCWIARPMERTANGLVQNDASLERLNVINEQIYRRMGEMADIGGEKMPYGHPAFVSRTKLEHTEYTTDSMRDSAGAHRGGRGGVRARGPVHPALGGDEPLLPAGRGRGRQGLPARLRARDAPHGARDPAHSGRRPRGGLSPSARRGARTASCGGRRCARRSSWPTPARCSGRA